MMVAFQLSGFIVHVSESFVTVDRRARIHSSDNGPVRVPLDDVAVEAPSFIFTAPTALLPGFVKFGPHAPAIRVTPAAVDTANRLVVLVTAAKAGDFAAEAQALVDTDTHGVDVIIDTPAPMSAVAPTPEFTQIAESGALPFMSEQKEDTSGSADRSLEDFVAFDVETANAAFGSVIQMGLAVVKNGVIDSTYSWLCRPPAGLEEFSEDNIAVHGIQPADVADQPSFTQRVQEFTEVVGTMPIVAHNAKFDFTAMYEGCQAAGIEAPEVKFGCTYRWARQAELGLQNLKLPTLAAAAGYDLTEHHDATADAIACAHIATWLMHKQDSTSVQELSETLSLSLGEISGGKLRQVRYKSGTTSGVAGRGGNWNQGARRQAKWDAAKTPTTIPKPNPHADPQGLLFGQRVTLTGDFDPFDKGQLWEKIADAGADINKGVTKKTTILVAGPWDSVTSKERRARELQEQGQDIEIWTKEQLFAALGLDEAEARKSHAQVFGSGAYAQGSFDDNAAAGFPLDDEPPF
ncbi:exonuclease domain-containing protein [Corynebacterium sp. H78]|uniref:exonuclease domain-containing protein n=1 Tax=Corynebacterium sp. H78 TaxID=3133417 RepID=UPI0030B2CCC7